MCHKYLLSSLFLISALILSSSEITAQIFIEEDLSSQVLNIHPNVFKFGLDTTAIIDHLDLCAQKRSTGCLIIYKGQLISEWYPDSLKNPLTVNIKTRSALKSWVSLIAGILYKQGKIDLNDLVSNYIPEWKAGADSGVTIKHLLTMTSGLKQRTVTAMRNGGPSVIQSADNQTEFAFSIPLTYSPGERWSYSNEGAQLLSPILERAAGIPLYKFAEKYLLKPLEMNDTQFMVDDFGNTITYAGASTTIRDFAKIGQLVLNKGKWNGKQIIPEDLIDLFTSPIPQMQNYGYLWWIDPNTNSIAAMGSQDNACIIYPDLDLVVVRMQKESYPDGNGNWMSPETVQMLRKIVE